MSQKLLLDANLSWRLVAMLQDDFAEMMHVVHSGLENTVSDSKIWDFAQKNNYNILSNDEDFYLLLMAKGFPPKIVLLRTGNQSTRYVALLLLKHKTEIISFLDQTEHGVLEIF